MWGLLLAAVAVQLPGAPLEMPTENVPEPFEVVEAESVFAVVTHKGGFAARLAHNHLIVASGYDVELTFDESDPMATAFAFSAPVDQLLVDPAESRQAWARRLADLDVEDDLGSPGEDDQRDIRNAMLGEKQLDFANHPTIEVQLIRISEGSQDLSGVVFPWMAEVEVTVRGVAVRRLVPMRYELAGDVLSVEAVGRFTFEEFGIEPYSAALGAVKNKNEFDLYLNMKATR